MVETGKDAYDSAASTGKQAYDATKGAAEDLAATLKSYLTWAQTKASDLTKTSKDTTNVGSWPHACLPVRNKIAAHWGISLRCLDACKVLSHIHLQMLGHPQLFSGAFRIPHQRCHTDSHCSGIFITKLFWAHLYFAEKPSLEPTLQSKRLMTDNIWV